MKKIVFSIMIISVISKIFGFGRELFFSYYFGASYVTDAYLVSTTIPLVIFSLVGVGINSAFIPIFTSISENKSKERAFTFTSRLLLSLFIICTLSYFIILVFTSPIVKIFASGFSGDILKLTVEYTRISALIIYFVIVINIFTALLQVNNKFYIASIIGIPFNIAYMIGIYIAYLKGNTYLPIVTVIAYLVQAFMLFYPVKKLGYKFKYNLGLKDKYLKQMLIIALPAIIGGSLEQVNYLIDKTVASRIGIKGGITLLNYSSKLNLAISGILISSLLVVFFPRISKLVAKNDRITLKNEILNTISFTMIVSIPISILILILRYEIISFLFQRGNFNKSNTIITAKCLLCYNIAFSFIGLREILSRIFYALKDTKTPVINSVIGVILNIFLNLTLSKYLGLPGIALATTISIIFTVILLFFTLYKKYKVLYIKEIIVTFLKVILASIVVGFIVYNTKNILINYPLILNLMFSSLVGIIIYILIIIFMRIEIVDDFVKQIKRNVIRRF
ncbi:murein biosynthesis integral membrane protein MurJ [Fusobacterium nucleatum subsp. nucleatum ATCC 23726]|uniref:Probable lipid II flippase MurJ n=2 Tax=Fusobacterium nucleatum TaxID=851 RepID=D5RFF5_FUSN2|nr:murein biosynthesis integral membrane protein MurJ [Fusobacterium nucleatum]AVQ22369.1 murein biosynthesis integral membrane protein MurJ [Fusobacterium nucleatum subsp. nucleatum ATCC 23726]EFG94419.1 integral membrane protein MviN [Fusobacterium nucleatum subsp. nucleatum ATCC 23726]